MEERDKEIIELEIKIERLKYALEEIAACGSEPEKDRALIALQYSRV